MARKRRKSRRTLLAASIIITVFAVALVFLAISQIKPTPPKKNSSDYFAISGPPSGPAATGRYAPGSNETIVLIDRFGFYFMPIIGDAHEVTLFMSGKILSEDFFWQEITNRTETFSGEILPKFEIISHRQADGYPVEIRIFSKEADGYLNVTIPVEDMSIIGLT